MITDEDLARLADGELPAPRREIVEAAAEADPVMAARLQSHRRLRVLAAEAFAGVLDDAVPPRLLAGLEGGRSPVVPLRRRPRPYWVAITAMAACLAVGVFVGQAVYPSQLLRQDFDGVRASGRLEQSLDRRLSRETTGQSIAIGLTFTSNDGSTCRTFVLRREATAGLACKVGDRWRVDATAVTARASETEYRTASTTLPTSLGAAVDARISGDAFNLEQEIKARSQGWNNK